MRPLGGGTYILTCTAINLHPIVKPFEMGTYLSVIKRSIFLFDHRMLESWDFGRFLKKVWQILDFWCITATLKKKYRKKWWKFFPFFLLLLCSVDCIMLPRLDIVLENYFSIPYEVKITSLELIINHIPMGVLDLIFLTRFGWFLHILTSTLQSDLMSLLTS